MQTLNLIQLHNCNDFKGLVLNNVLWLQPMHGLKESKFAQCLKLWLITKLNVFFQSSALLYKPLVTTDTYGQNNLFLSQPMGITEINPMTQRTHPVWWQLALPHSESPRPSWRARGRDNSWCRAPCLPSCRWSWPRWCRCQPPPPPLAPTHSTHDRMSCSSLSLK